MYRIIYPNNDTISVVIPSDNYDIHFVAKKDVPEGIPYKIININDLPLDRTFRDAWTADFSNPDGYGEGAIV